MNGLTVLPLQLSHPVVSAMSVDIFKCITISSNTHAPAVPMYGPEFKHQAWWDNSIIFDY